MIPVAPDITASARLNQVMWFTNEKLTRERGTPSAGAYSSSPLPNFCVHVRVQEACCPTCCFMRQWASWTSARALERSRRAVTRTNNVVARFTSAVSASRPRNAVTGTSSAVMRPSYAVKSECTRRCCARALLTAGTRVWATVAVRWPARLAALRTSRASCRGASDARGVSREQKRTWASSQTPSTRLSPTVCFPLPLQVGASFVLFPLISLSALEPPLMRGFNRVKMELKWNILRGHLG